MTLSLRKSFLIIIANIFVLTFSKDADCALKQSITQESQCQEVKTGTSNICCFYKEDSSTKCIPADGSTPQTTLSSIELIKTTIPPTSITKQIACGTKAEKCSNIASPTSFASCNITLLDFPYSCCFVETRTIKRCYPVNARYNTTVAIDAEKLKAQFNYSEVPKIICSTVDLPFPARGIALSMNYLALFIVMILI